MKNNLLFPLALALATAVSSSAWAQTPTSKPCAVVHRALPRKHYIAPAASIPTQPPAPQKVEVEVHANATLKVPDPLVLEVHVTQSTIPTPVVIERNDVRPEASTEEVAKLVTAPSSMIVVATKKPVAPVIFDDKGKVCTKQDSNPPHACLNDHQPTVADFQAYCISKGYGPESLCWSNIEALRTANSTHSALFPAWLNALADSANAGINAQHGPTISNASASANASASSSSASSAQGGQVVIQP
jgi:hypothetical protein